MAKEEIVLLGCGDVGPVFEPLEPLSVLVRPTLAMGDIRFAQCERMYSDRGSYQVQAVDHSRLKPHMAAVFSDCGFDVVSVATNHGMDWGADALLDTIELFRKKGIKTIGAGRNIEEAREPVIIEQNGVRVAMLGYCSILAKGYQAGPNKPGVAPLRVHTSYQQLEYQHPGIPPHVVTIPDAEDLENIVEDIVNAKKTAHVVVVSLHWGLHFIPRMIAEYQPTVANAIFKAGADLILGHHSHNAKAIGVHNGKVCFYSLSNFLISSPGFTPTPAKQAAFSKRYGVAIDTEFLHLSHGTVDGRRSLIAKVVLSREGVKRVSFLPVLIDKQLRPEVLRFGDPRFDEAVKYMEWASEGFDHKFVVEGDEVIVTGA